MKYFNAFHLNYLKISINRVKFKDSLQSNSEIMQSNNKKYLTSKISNRPHRLLIINSRIIKVILIFF
jgi:hypothetical protein